MDRGLRRQWEQALRRIPMPEPFEAVAFCELLGPHLGRELVLVPKASTGGPCGMVARTDTTDFIFYETATRSLLNKAGVGSPGRTPLAGRSSDAGSVGGSAPTR